VLTLKNQTKVDFKKAILLSLIFVAIEASPMGAHGMSSDSQKLFAEAKARAEAEMRELQIEHQKTLRDLIAKETIGDDSRNSNQAVAETTTAEGGVRMTASVSASESR
jgi:hypothetical protein